MPEHNSLVTDEHVTTLMDRIKTGAITTYVALQITKAISAGEGTDVDKLIDAKGMRNLQDACDDLDTIVSDVLKDNFADAKGAKAGVKAAENNLMHKAMWKTKGKANPTQIKALIQEKLGYPLCN